MAEVTLQTDAEIMKRCMKELLIAQPQLDEDSAARMCEERMKTRMPQDMPPTMPQGQPGELG